MNSLLQKKLLLIEHDEVLLDFLENNLSYQGFDVSSCTRGEHLPTLLERKKVQFDLVILALELPGNNGVYWLKWLQQYHPQIPVILVLKRSCAEERLSCLENGARDYILSPFREQELIIRIENILGTRKKNRVANRYISIGNMRIDVKKHEVTNGGDVIALTELELKIIQLLYLNAGTPMSREAIMMQIRGGEFSPMDRSIDIHINKIRKKIEREPSKPVYIRTVRGKGYSLDLS